MTVLYCSDDIATTIITRFDEFVALAAEWDELLESAANPEPSQRHHWLELAWRQAERRWQSPRVVLVRRGGKLQMAGAFALGIDRFKPTIAFLTGSLPVTNEVLWREGGHSVDDAVALLQALRASLFLPRTMRHVRLRDTSPFFAAVKRLSLPHSLRESWTNHFLLPGEFADHASYITNSGRDVRHDHRRRVRRLEEAGKFEFRRVQGEAGRPVLKWLLDTKRLWLNERDKSAPWLKTRRVDEFLDQLMFGPGAPAWSLWTIFVDDKPLAVQLSFDEAKVWHFQMVAYDPAAKQFAPGRTVILLAIRQAFAEDIERVDIGITGADWKDRLVNGQETVIDMRVRIK